MLLRPALPPLLLLLLLLLLPCLGISVAQGDTEAAAAAAVPTNHDNHKGSTAPGETPTAAPGNDHSSSAPTPTPSPNEEDRVSGRSLPAGDDKQNTASKKSALKSSSAEESAGLLDDGTAREHNYILEADSANYENAVEGDYTERIPVRKCCSRDMFFSLETQQCEAALEDTGFLDQVRRLMRASGSEPGALQLVPGLLQACPGTGLVPTISEVGYESHSLISGGLLRSAATGDDHDHDHYCLELAASGPQLLASGFMVAAHCQPWPSRILSRKCCNLYEYYDHARDECIAKMANMTDHETLVREFIRNDVGMTSVQVKAGQLTCDHGAPRILVADQTYLDATSQLCERLTGQCHSTSSYCIEYLWAPGDTTMTAVASVCPLDAFHKCCPRDYVLTEAGCAPAARGDVSALMMQLLEVLDPQYGFPTENGNQLCVHEMITPDDADVRWLISKSGYLSVDTHGESHDTMLYCVDDYLAPDNRTQTVAVVCHTELEKLVNVHLSSHPSQAGSVGKCCPHDHYYSAAAHSCLPDESGLQLLQHPHLMAANVTKLTFTSFPVCDALGGYHHYYLDPDLQDDDHATLAADHTVEVVGLESGCVFVRHSFPRHAYCLEYTINGTDMRPGVLVCSGAWSGHDLHTEKFSLTGILLGVSCAALFITAFSLISTRVRRGLVTVKKVNTLAGKILLSYVLSYLVGFLLLMVNMKIEVEEGNSECQVIAWLLIFFLLAAFQWNTSICLESLLLTLHVETSESLRYLYHSLWAWGVPGLIASLALTLDHYRRHLPCSVITPKVGLYRCFFSDPTAHLVYFYAPMLISLVANMVLLTVSRYVRTEKLKRLEYGRRPDREGTEMQAQGVNNNNKPSGHAPPSSGLRTHQTRNLWLESVKLVVWSGVTWLLEVMSFVFAKYMVKPSESWYDYLWYLPSSVNALRGVGIFVILVLTPERRIKIRRKVANVADRVGVRVLGRPPKCGEASSSGSSGNMQSSVGGASEVGGAGRRNMSIATTITQVSSVRSSQSNDSRPDSAGASRTVTHPHLAYSVSQMDTRRSSLSSQSSESEGPELDPETGAGGRRKSSLATYGVVSLPSVHEEDDGTRSLSPDNTSEA